MFISGNSNPESWNVTKPTDFFLFKAYVTSILNRIGVSKTNEKPTENDVFSEGISIAFGNDVLVEFGTVKNSILKHFDIKQEVFFADFNWDLVLKTLSNKIKFQDIPKFPEVRRDLALLIDNSIKFETIYDIAKQTEKSLLKSVNLFDVYEGKNLPEGKNRML